MTILVLGGTRFIGPWVVRRLADAGHDVTVFHRGQSKAVLPASVAHLHGDRQQLLDFKDAFARLAPEVVFDLFAMTEADAQAGVAAFAGLARRVVVASSQDVYRVYDRFLGRDPGPPGSVPFTEQAPLRRHLYPYRTMAPAPDHLFYHYDKILVEQVYQRAEIPATVVRLPQVYGPGDYQHRLFPYLKRMDDARPFIPLDEDQDAWRCTRGYVENVAAALALAVEDERAAGAVYNVGEAVAFTEAEWIRRIGAVTGWAGRVVSLPKLPDMLPSDKDWRHHFVADTRTMRRELGYEEPVSLDEALRRTIAWERAHPPEAIDPKQFDYAAEDARLADRS